MEQRNPGNKKMNDFNKLTDRMIVEQPSTPMLVIKTNLDPNDSTENNPYFQDEKTKDPSAFRDFFEE